MLGVGDAHYESFSTLLDLVDSAEHMKLFRKHVVHYFIICRSLRSEPTFLSSPSPSTSKDHANIYTSENNTDAIRLISRMVGRRHRWLRLSSLLSSFDYSTPQCDPNDRKAVARRKEFMVHRLTVGMDLLRDKGLLEWTWDDGNGGKDGEVQLDAEGNLFIIENLLSLHEIKKLANSFGIDKRHIQTQSKRELLGAIRHKALNDKTLFGQSCHTRLPSLCRGVLGTERIVRLKPVVKSSLRRLQRLQTFTAPEVLEYDAAYVPDDGRLGYVPLLVAYNMRRYERYLVKRTVSIFPSVAHFERWEAAHNIAEFVEKARVNYEPFNGSGKFGPAPLQELREVVDGAIRAFFLKRIHRKHLMQPSIHNSSPWNGNKYPYVLEDNEQRVSASASLGGLAEVVIDSIIKEPNYLQEGLMIIATLCLIADCAIREQSQQQDQVSKGEKGHDSHGLECLNMTNAGRRLAYIVSDLFSHFEYGGEDYVMAIRLLALLFQSGYLRHRRGRWYLRMCIDLEHVQRHHDSLSVLTQAGLRDTSIRISDRVAMEQKLSKLERRLRIDELSVRETLLDTEMGEKESSEAMKEELLPPWLRFQDFDLSTPALVAHIFNHITHTFALADDSHQQSEPAVKRFKLSSARVQHNSEVHEDEQKKGLSYSSSTACAACGLIVSDSPLKASAGTALHPCPLCRTLTAHVAAPVAGFASWLVAKCEAEQETGNDMEAALTRVLDLSALNSQAGVNGVSIGSGYEDVHRLLCPPPQPLPLMSAPNSKKKVSIKDLSHHEEHKGEAPGSASIDNSIEMVVDMTESDVTEENSGSDEALSPSDLHYDLLQRLDLDQHSMVAAPPVVALEGRRYGISGQRGKSRFIGPVSAEAVSVERWVMEHFQGGTNSDNSFEIACSSSPSSPQEAESKRYDESALHADLPADFITLASRGELPTYYGETIIHANSKPLGQYERQETQMTDYRAPRDTAGNAVGGWIGWHCEGSHLRSLFALLMWDCIFYPLENVFQTQFQDAPLDLNYPSFFSSRENVCIAPRLKEIRLMDISELVAEVCSAYRKHYRLECRPMRWETPLPELQLVAASIGSQGLSAICLALSLNYSAFASGLPDLLLVRTLAKFADGSTYVIEASEILKPSGKNKDEQDGNDMVKKPATTYVQGSIQGVEQAKTRMTDERTKLFHPNKARRELDYMEDTKDGDLKESNAYLADAEPEEDTLLRGCHDSTSSLPGRDSFEYNGAEINLPEIEGAEIDYQALLIEVKGPNDRLSDKQTVWLNLLNRHDVPSLVCRVNERVQERNVSMEEDDTVRDNTLGGIQKKRRSKVKVIDRQGAALHKEAVTHESAKKRASEKPSFTSNSKVPVNVVNID